MALIIKLLNALQTNVGSLTTVYSASADTVVKNIRFATSGSSGTINLRLNPSGAAAARLILNKDKALAANDILVVTPEITMKSGDTIEVTTSVAMDCVVCGAEKV